MRATSAGIFYSSRGAKIEVAMEQQQNNGKQADTADDRNPALPEGSEAMGIMVDS